MATPPAPEDSGPAAAHAGTTPWRALTRDRELPGLVATAAQAQADAARVRAALARLVEHCRPLAEEIARSYAWREADIADMAQEALLRLSRDLPQLRDPVAFPSWFSSLAHHACRRWAQRERRRQAERSLDVPARPGWLGTAEGPQPLDLPDPDSARAMLTLENGDYLQRLLQTLPLQQRIALTAAYGQGHSHEQVGKELGVSSRAAEGLVYRALRRLQAVAAQCMEEPEEIEVWCPLCGRRRLLFQILPGVSARAPLWRRWRCTGCGFASPAWTAPNLTSLARFASLEEAWWQERFAWAREALSMARQRSPRCWKCGAPVRRRDRLADSGAGGPPLYVLHWSCFNCDVGTHYSYLPTAGLLPEWPAFWRSAPRLLLTRGRVVKTAGEEQVVLGARDRDSGRRATLAVDRATLAVRRFELEDR